MIDVSPFVSLRSCGLIINNNEAAEIEKSPEEENKDDQENGIDLRRTRTMIFHTKVIIKQAPHGFSINQ